MIKRESHARSPQTRGYTYDITPWPPLTNVTHTEREREISRPPHI